MPNDPSMAGVKHVKNKQGGYTLRDKAGKRVTKAAAHSSYQKVYAKQYATDLGQSAWRDMEKASVKFKKGVRQRAAGTRQRARAKGRRKAA